VTTTGAASASLIVAVAQSMAMPGELERSVRHHVELGSRAGEAGARIVVFPELSLTGYALTLTARDALQADDPRLAPLRALATSHGMFVTVGAPVLSPRGLHIGALTFGPGGTSHLYLKQYLHPGEEVAFVAGAEGTPFALEGHRVGVAICADITHREHARAAARSGASIYATSCFLTERGYDLDAALLRDYARVHRMTVLLANYGAPIEGWRAAGRSAIWSREGRLLAESPPEGPALITAAIDAQPT
jgi:predicted amidohydrolase